jgi:hypothetical protein
MRIKLLLVSLMLCLSMPTKAKDMKGKFGLGYTQTLGGVHGVSFRYWAGRKLGIETVFNMEVIDRNSLRSSTAVSAAFGILYGIVQHRHANLSVAIRADVGFRTSPTERQQTVTVGNAVNTETHSVTAEASESTFHVNLELPIIAEFFFSDSFSVNLAVGLVAVFVPDEGAILETSGPGATVNHDEFGFGIGAGGLLGSAGFTFYF